MLPTCMFVSLSSKFWKLGRRKTTSRNQIARCSEDGKYYSKLIVHAYLQQGVKSEISGVTPHPNQRRCRGPGREDCVEP